MSSDDELTVDRSDSYATTDVAADATSRMNRRLALDFRERLRAFSTATPFTPGWERCVEVVQFLSSVALLEEREQKAKKASTAGDGPASPAQKAGAEQPGLARAGSSAKMLEKQDTTLWEREEFCARQIVEEGKVNLLMRSLAEFKSQLITSCVEGRAPQGKQHSLSVLYESGVGNLLRITLVAVEAIQTLDVRAMLEHFGRTWDFALSPLYKPAVIQGPTKSGKNAILSYDFLLLQEGMSFAILAGIFRVISELREDEIMEKFFDLGLQSKILLASERMMGFITNQPKESDLPMTNEVALQVKEFTESLCKCWNYILMTETYSTKMAAFWPGGKADKQKFVAVLGPVTKTVLAEHPDWKKELRPLSDALLRFG